jgi:hypothetical protein
MGWTNVTFVRAGWWNTKLRRIMRVETLKTKVEKEEEEIKIRQNCLRSSFRLWSSGQQGWEMYRLWIYRVFPKRLDSFSLVWSPTYIANITVFGVLAFRSVERMFCPSWQWHKDAIIKMACTVEQRVFLVKILQAWNVLFEGQVLYHDLVISASISYL